MAKPATSKNGQLQDDQISNISISQKELKRVQDIFVLLCENYKKCDPIVFVYLQKLEEASAKDEQNMETLGIDGELYSTINQEIIANALDLLIRDKQPEKFSLSKKEKSFLKKALELSIILPDTPSLNPVTKLFPQKPREELSSENSFVGCFSHLG